MNLRKSCTNSVGISKYTGLLLISPFIIGLSAFTIYPFVRSIIGALQTMEISDGIMKTHYSMNNFKKVIIAPDVLKAIGVTLKYAAVLVPLKLIFSLLTAMLLNIEIKGMRIFRTIFYIPSILGSNLAIVIMWQYLFTSHGLINQFLELIGLSPVSWYGDPRAALSIIILLRLWEFGSTMVIFLAALRDIPKDYYDAARVDGCGCVRAFLRITLPMLKNVIFINLVLQTISALQEFSAPYMITGGNPLKSTYTVGMLIYDSLFRSFNMEYGYAVSCCLFAFIAVIIFIMYKLSGRFREEI